MVNDATSPRYSRVTPDGDKESSMSARPQSHRKPWTFDSNRSLTWMVLSLISGIAFCVGHHFFYANYDSLEVDSVDISQTWIIRIGTGFAFVAKTLLVVATSIAFVQYQWMTLSKQCFKIRQIDSMTGILGNALSFLESRMWLRFPVLTLLAVGVWYVR
jgi:hypothetical protein